MRVYRNSDNIQNFVEGIPPGFFIVGDKAYRAVVNLRVPETNRGIDDYTAHQLGKQRILVENAFGLLKGKFKRLEMNQRNGGREKYMIMVIAAATIHNILLD